MHETLEWLRKAAESGLPEWSPKYRGEESKLKWKGLLDETKGACQKLISDGGADYDGVDVNAYTVLSVLKGEGPGKVVPRGQGSGVILGLYSHGWSHESSMGEERVNAEVRT